MMILLYSKAEIGVAVLVRAEICLMLYIYGTIPTMHQWVLQAIVIGYDFIRLLEFEFYLFINLSIYLLLFLYYSRIIYYMCMRLFGHL